MGSYLARQSTNEIAEDVFGDADGRYMTKLEFIEIVGTAKYNEKRRVLRERGENDG